MPHVTADDGIRLYYEETGSGIPVVFVHEFAGDHRAWEAQVRHFARSYRCVTYNARGDPPSSGEGQDIMAAIGIPTHEIVLDRDLPDDHRGWILNVRRRHVAKCIQLLQSFNEFIPKRICHLHSPAPRYAPADELQGRNRGIAPMT